MREAYEQQTLASANPRPQHKRRRATFSVAYVGRRIMAVSAPRRDKAGSQELDAGSCLRPSGDVTGQRSAAWRTRSISTRLRRLASSEVTSAFARA